MPLGLHRQSKLGSSTIDFTTSAGLIGTILDNNRTNLPGPIVATSSSGSAVTFEITLGSMPAGLTLNSNGTITGTATQVAVDTTSTFTVKAFDEEGASDVREFSIIVETFRVATAINFNPTSTSAPGLGFPNPIATTDASFVRTTNSIVTTGSSVTEFTVAFWIKPASSLPGGTAHIFSSPPGANPNQFVCSINSNGDLLIETHQPDHSAPNTGLEVFKEGCINFNQWNSVVASFSVDNTIVSFGAGGDSVSGGTSKNHKIHLAVNNTVSITGKSSVNNLFFNRANVSANTQYGETRNDLFDNASTDDTLIGCQDGTASGTSVSYYKGDLAHVFMQDTFYDLEVTDNLRKFVNPNNKPQEYPSSPTVLFEGNATNFASSGSINEGTITRTNISNASSKPSD